jgi:hypothetical protein
MRELFVNREERAEDRERLRKNRSMGCDARCRLSKGRSLTPQIERERIVLCKYNSPQRSGLWFMRLCPSPELLRSGETIVIWKKCNLKSRDRTIVKRQFELQSWDRSKSFLVLPRFCISVWFYRPAWFSYENVLHTLIERYLSDNNVQIHVVIRFQRGI